MNPKIKHSAELEQKILASIRAGGYPHVAAQAWGLPPWLFDKWMEWGRKTNAREPYKSFALKVDQAQAQARLKAEMAAYEDEPRFWLKNGPGKETPKNPGWSTMMKPIITQEHKTLNLFTSPDFLQFMATMRAVLAPYPEALAALTAALDKPPQLAPPPPKPTFNIFPPPSNN